MKILVTGGAGYIGSHTVLSLIQKGYEVCVFDSLEHGHKQVLDIISEITGTQVKFYQGNLLDMSSISKAIEDAKPDGVIHFAAYLSVGESVSDPLKYYRNNIMGGVNLLEAMRSNGIKQIVFSSTAAVFGQPEEVPIKETTTKSPINPYGQSKLNFEQVLEDTRKAHGINYVALRYFNAAGAEPSGKIGEDHNPELHLIPIVLEAALGHRDAITVFGADYPTKDGTCIRDYVHVLDLADAHIKALEFMTKENKSETFNLGSAHGYSVKEVIEAVERITGKHVPVKIGERRAGDPAVLIADNTKARTTLGWEIQYGLDAIISSAWNWETGLNTYDG